MLSKMKGDHPKIAPIRVKEYTTNQSKWEHVPRRCLLGPLRTEIPGAVRPCCYQNLVLKVYRGVFSRVFVFSPSVFLDATWAPVLQYCKDELGCDEKKEPYAFDGHDHDALERIINQQFQVAKLCKERGRHVFSVLDYPGRYKRRA